MKIIILLVNFTLVFSQVPQNSSNAWANIVSRYKTECLCESGANPAVVERWLFKYGFPNDACLMCFIKCVTLKLGLLNPDGSINIPANIAIIPQIPGTSNSLLYNCTNQTENIADICRKAFDFSFCVQKALVKGR